jgi:single-strand selective monofunctional uracil DNA glycosylase
MSLAAIDRALSDEVDQLEFDAPVCHVYNPLRYARAPHEAFLERFGRGRKEVLFLGMNPGPWGMAQTGVPFGDIAMVRDWMGITGRVDKPDNEHPKRPVTGFDCVRSEVSGSRLWGWARDRFDSPDAFFERFFVINFCPLVFLEDTGRNRTPNKLPKAERAPLVACCNEALRAAIELLAPRIVVGIGVYARDAAKRVVADRDVEVGCVLHPSPASPKANRGWAKQAEQDLAAAGVELPPAGG